jgi:hypothetical protein
MSVEGSSVTDGCTGSPLVESVRGVCAARFGLEGGEAGLEWGRLDGRGLRSAAEELQRAIGSLQHHQRLVLRLIEERRAYAAVGSRDAADWAAGRLGMSRRAVTDGIEVARKLDAFPALAEKTESGELSPEQTRPALDLAATTAATGTDPNGFGWALTAPGMGVAALRRRAARVRRPGAVDHATARAVRTFEAWSAGQELRFKGSVPIDAGATLLKAIERAMPARDGANPATLGQRQADGLVALASATVGADADPDRATVVVIAELAAICDDDPRATAELETGEPLATETARRLVCDSRLSVLVQDPTGRAVGVGTTARTVGPALRRALMVRDGHCRFGDCTARRFLHAHHIAHWPAPTEMSNLAMVCYVHHHSLHEGGWTLTGDPFGRLTARHPDGRRSAPNHPQNHEDSAPPRPPPEPPPADRRPADRPPADRLRSPQGARAALTTGPAGRAPAVLSRDGPGG